MWMRIAMKLGMSVRRAKLEVSSAEYADWVALFEHEPWGEHIEDLRVGTLMSLLYNMNRGKDAPALNAADFTPWSGWSRESLKPRIRSAQEIAASTFGIDLEAAKRAGAKRIVVRNGEVIEG
ncbi:phage tail assembly protein T [Caballeronia sp. HLA56]